MYVQTYWSVGANHFVGSMWKIVMVLSSYTRSLICTCTYPTLVMAFSQSTIMNCDCICILYSKKKKGTLPSPAHLTFAQPSKTTFFPFCFSLYIINGWLPLSPETECIVKVFVEVANENLKWCHKISFIRTGLCEHKNERKAHFTMCKFQFEWIRFVSLWFVASLFLSSCSFALSHRIAFFVPTEISVWQWSMNILYVSVCVCGVHHWRSMCLSNCKLFQN